jgi:hypothetical protein
MCDLGEAHAGSFDEVQSSDGAADREFWCCRNACAAAARREEESCQGKDDARSAPGGSDGYATVAKMKAFRNGAIDDRNE